MSRIYVPINWEQIELERGSFEDQEAAYWGEEDDQFLKENYEQEILYGTCELLGDTCQFWGKAYYFTDDEASLERAKQVIRDQHSAECQDCPGKVIFAEC